LINHSLDYSWEFYWISVGVLLGYTFFFYIAFGLALAYRKRKFTNENAMACHKLLFTLETNHAAIVSAIQFQAYRGNMPRKCSTNGQEEEINIKKESDDHANNVPQKGNPINQPPACPHSAMI